LHHPTKKLRRLLREHAFTRELVYEPSKYERAVLTLPKIHSTTQAFGDSAKIVSCDQENELMISLKASCKKPY